MVGKSLGGNTTYLDYDSYYCVYTTVHHTYMGPFSKGGEWGHPYLIVLFIFLSLFTFLIYSCGEVNKLLRVRRVPSPPTSLSLLFLLANIFQIHAFFYH